VTLQVYTLTRHFPADELYGLTSQMRRAAASIGANLAEGCGRDGDAELARFARIARGSVAELEYHLLLARDLHLISEPDYQELAAEAVALKRMLTAFIPQKQAPLLPTVDRREPKATYGSLEADR